MQMCVHVCRRVAVAWACCIFYILFVLLKTGVSSVSTVTLKIELHVSTATATLDKTSYETQVSHNM